MVMATVVEELCNTTIGFPTKHIAVYTYQCSRRTRPLPHHVQVSSHLVLVQSPINTLATLQTRHSRAAHLPNDRLAIIVHRTPNRLLLVYFDLDLFSVVLAIELDVNVHWRCEEERCHGGLVHLCNHNRQ